MAAVHNQSSRQHLHSRLRTSSDPFDDPRSKKIPPPPPPKTSATRMPLVEAVRDTVTIQDPRRKANPPNRRSQSDDSGPSKSRKTRRPHTKSSQHADAIDGLDFTGGTMFHHDGPFDACAPSRNKNYKKAPIFSWGKPPAPPDGDGAYPSADADVYKAFSNDYPEPPKKKVDAIAEAWGIHEPEPFEEFFAGGGSKQDDTPASSIYEGNDEPYSRRSIAPPPKPIFTEPEEIEPGSPLPTSTKRSKSLMHRIRKMRDAPNVPVGHDYNYELPSPPSPTSPRPTHRSQNSFLGRFGGVPRNQLHEVEQEDPYVYIDQTNKGEPQNKEEPQTNKELPVLPTVAPGSSSGDMGRKTSIIRRLVRGTR